MELAGIIVGGLIAMTALAGLFDFLGKKKTSLPKDIEKRIASLEQKQESLEHAISEKEDKIRILTQDVRFLNNLLETRIDEKKRIE